METEEVPETEGVRRSARIAENKVFFNIHGVENDGSADKPPAVVFKFEREIAKSIDFNHEMEKGDLTYAPSLRNPYYMSIPASQLTVLKGNALHMLQWATEAQYVEGEETRKVSRTLPDVEINSCFYISLKLFHDIANDEVDWLSLSRLEDPQVTPTPDTKTLEEAETLKEIAFAGLGDPPKKDPIDLEPYEPPLLRLESQNKLKQDKEMEIEKEKTINEAIIDWLGTRRTIGDDIASDPDTARRIYIPIRHKKGWLIWLRFRDWSTDRQRRRGQLRSLKETFEKLWMINTATDPESAAGYRPRYSSSDLGFPLYVVPEVENLRLRLGWETNEITTLFGGLVEEINNGRTYTDTKLITKTQVEVDGANFLKMGENPFGLFTTYVSTDNFNKYMQSLEAISGTAENLAKKDAHRRMTTSDTYLESWLQSHCKAMAPEMYTDPQTIAKRAVDNWMNSPDRMEDRLYVKGEEHSSTWRIGLSWDKVQEAGGKRMAKYSPREIMGMSANEATEQAFGWQVLDQAYQYLGHQHRLSNGMYMAEWLHLCAFSWGGLSTSPESTEIIYRSSDIPENLILGTSETNSVMTRFEKAWQALVRDESGEWTNEAGNSTFHANLVVERNRNAIPVVRDAKADNLSYYYRTAEVMKSTECQTAKLFHFVAYTISYSIKFPLGCKLLAMEEGSSLETTFYPFLRPLYHRLEDQLDQVLYERIKARDSDMVLPDRVNELSLGTRPFATNSQNVFDGTGKYGDLSELGIERYTTQGLDITRKGPWKTSKYPHDMDGMIKQDVGVMPEGQLRKKPKGYSLRVYKHI